MGFLVRTKRVIDVDHTLDLEGVEYDLSVTMELIAGEDMDYAEIRQKLDSSKSKKKIIDEETGKEIDSDTYNTFLYTLRKSLTACKGFTDEEGKDISIKNDKGEIEENLQIAVFETIRLIPEFFDKFVTAYNGETSKN